MDKYFTIQRLVEIQKERKEAVEKVFVETLGFLANFEVEYRLEDKRKDLLKLNIRNEDISFLVKVKVKDKSSVRFIVNQNKQKILDMYSKIFVNDFLVIN